jgi:hypothetical protein
VRECAESLSHRRAVDHGEHRNAEQHREIGAGSFAVEQSHHAFDQDQIGFAGSLVDQFATVRLAAHPQIELVDRSARGPFQDHRVEKIGTGLEYPNPAA